MNETAADSSAPARDHSPEAITRMREFLARVVRTPISAICLTGNPATDLNADLVKAAAPGPGNDWSRPSMIEKLCALTAIHLDNVLAEGSNPELGAELFERYVCQRSHLYP